MNIAYVSNVVYPFVTGGAEKRIYEIGTRLVDRGHEVTVYGRHFWDGPPETTYDGLRLRAVADERDLYTNGRRSIREAIAFAGALPRPLAKHAPTHDVIIASVFPYFPVLSAAGVAQRYDTAFVTTWHECWRAYWWDYLGTLGAGGIAIERLVAKLPQTPIAVSAVTADRLAAIGPDREAITVIPNGIDYDRIRETDPATNGFDILFVGRLVAAKNVELLLEATTELPPTISVGIIGEGPTRDHLEALAEQLGIDDRVTFLGHLTEYSSVLAHLRAACVYASPSTREGFGLTLVESMAADCTVVAVDHPHSAAAEVVGEAGLLVDPEIEPFRAALQRALRGDRPPENPVARAEKFDWTQVTDRAESAYEDAIARKD